MGAGASAQETFTQNEVKQIAGELYDEQTFHLNAGPDGYVSRESFRKVASERGFSLDSSEDSRRFSSASAGNIRRKPSSRHVLRGGSSVGRLKKPTSVADLALGHLLTRKQAWQSSSTLVEVPGPGANSNEARRRVSSPQTPPVMETAANARTPMAQHKRAQEPKMVESPYGGNFQTPLSKHASCSLSLPHEDPRPQQQPTSAMGAPSASELATPQLLAPPKGFALSKLDLSAPMADPSGVTLMTDPVGSMRRLVGPPPLATGGSFSAIVPSSSVLPMPLNLSFDVGGSGNSKDARGIGNGNDNNDGVLDDLLEGVEGVVEVDDSTWGDGIATPRRNRRPMTLALEAGSMLNDGSQHSLNTGSSGDSGGNHERHDESYMFTKSGAINLNGVALPIRDTGMVQGSLSNMTSSSSGGFANGQPHQQQGTNTMEGARASNEEEGGEGYTNSGAVGNNSKALAKLPLSVRVVRLERLGAGAAGIVYKGFDLMSLELVALKEIPIFDRNKRRQMVLELNSLYKNLKDAHRLRGAANQEAANQKAANGQEEKDMKEDDQQADTASRSAGDSHSKAEARAEGGAAEAKATAPSTISDAKKPIRSATMEAAQGIENVVAFKDAFSNMGDATVSLMVEYMNGGSLQSIADNGGCDDPATLASIASQTLKGMRFLHRGQHLHRDIKPANILINYQGEVKVSDFGIVRKLSNKEIDDDDGDKGAGGASNGLMRDPGDGMMVDPGASYDDCQGGGNRSGGLQRLESAHTFVGTVTYMSPERINGEAYSTPADIWSFGLSLMTVALGKMPLATSSGYWSLLSAVRDDPPPTFPVNDTRWPESLRDFCARCLEKDPNQRASCDELLAHPFLKEFPADVGAVLDAKADLNAATAATLVEVINELHEQADEEEEEEEEGVVLSPSTEALELRLRAESELEALLDALVLHFASNFAFDQDEDEVQVGWKRQEPLKRRFCSLALLNNAAVALAATPRDALVALFHSDARRDGLDALTKVARQLNLPLSLVRARVDEKLAAAEGSALSIRLLHKGDEHCESMDTLDSEYDAC